MLPWPAGQCWTRVAQATLPPSLSPSLGYPPQLPKCLPPVVGGGGISGRPTNGRRVRSANGRDGLLQVIPMQADRAYCLLDTAGAWLSLLNEVDTCQKWPTPSFSSFHFWTFMSGKRLKFSQNNSLTVPKIQCLKASQLLQLPQH